MIPTSKGSMAPAQIISELSYISYSHNRGLGMSAASLGKMFNVTGAAMEARYQQEQQQAEAA